MKCLFPLSIILPVLIGFDQKPLSPTFQDVTSEHFNSDNPYATIADIPVPTGFERLPLAANSFAYFLRTLPLKKSKAVFLYNGRPKSNQDVQFAVVDISTGVKDLQQCADAIMRLRAEYYYKQKEFLKIIFTDNANVNYRYDGSGGRASFDQYLEKVFSHCGTLSLEKQLQKRSGLHEAEIGDVFIKGGSPGHAMMIVDMAINKEGKKIYLLLQGYMPAQDVHVVKNPGNEALSPWYPIDNSLVIDTPEWRFFPSQLRHW